MSIFPDPSLAFRTAEKTVGCNSTPEAYLTPYDGAFTPMWENESPRIQHQDETVFAVPPRETRNDTIVTPEPNLELDYAIRSKSAALVACCVNQPGVDVNMACDNNETPLFTAMRSGEIEIAAILVENGAVTSGLSRRGFAIMDYCVAISAKIHNTGASASTSEVGAFYRIMDKVESHTINMTRIPYEASDTSHFFAHAILSPSFMQRVRVLNSNNVHTVYTKKHTIFLAAFIASAVNIHTIVIARMDISSEGMATFLRSLLGATSRHVYKIRLHIRSSGKPLDHSNTQLLSVLREISLSRRFEVLILPFSTDTNMPCIQDSVEGTPGFNTIVTW